MTEEEDAAGDGAAGLPPRSVRRWVASRKAAVVHAVLGGKLTAEQACRSYDLSGEELQGWIAAVRNHGEGALKATSLRKFR
ncbi:hypothetical protein ATO5_02965 [Loktanella sp. 22II-4b]|nr:hypothetical protein ATO5_02965 [Loktanella sp. 22II-4b]